MNKKEKFLIECLEQDIKDNNFESAKYIIKTNDRYIFSSKRTGEFNKKFNLLNNQIEWNGISEENFDYYNQENKISDDPHIL